MQEQRQPLYLAFVDLTKTIHLVSRNGFFTPLKRIGCPPTLISIVKSLHTNMKSTVSFDGNMSKPVIIKSGVQQGCVLALFRIFFSVLLSYAFQNSTDLLFLRTTHDDKLFNLRRLRAKPQVTHVHLMDMLFANDEALANHSKELQRLKVCFSGSSACSELELTISIKKTEAMCQDTSASPAITISGVTFAIVDEFKYLGSVISINMSLDDEISTHIGKAAAVMSKLKTRVWTKYQPVTAHQASCLHSSLWQRNLDNIHPSRARLNTFPMSCLRKISKIVGLSQTVTSQHGKNHAQQSML